MRVLSYNRQLFRCFFCPPAPAKYMGKDAFFMLHLTFLSRLIKNTQIFTYINGNVDTYTITLEINITVMILLI